ncbi:nicotinate (nicotinamide) nucleotide adenylyltransferase [uncultured Clostridium sp.]|uniref:nicotinate (nicotinamide) nucleotide adenylyltransferase n=1 Tax=uncultured Clostridium sp. TaxID=59620 RepID=UPI0026054A16|nr:nicotinate (nicotinamide) nucleotide adenylyltransferase [uncultured Clostridium sp.]
MNKKLTAIYGGSFNPPTVAHENIARDILKLEEVEHLVYLPVGDNYKKKSLISANYRYEMLKIILKKLKKDSLDIDINKLEIEASERLYTIESLRILKSQYKNDLAFVMGTDNVKEFSTWKNPRELLEEFYFIVIERENDDVGKLISEDELLNIYKDKFIILRNTSYKLVSSTYIRRNLYLDKNIQNYIDFDILEYIKINKLYKGGELSK